MFGPDESPYAGKNITLDIDIPDDYPNKALQCYVNKGLYHINVLQS